MAEVLATQSHLGMRAKKIALSDTSLHLHLSPDESQTSCIQVRAKPPVLPNHAHQTQEYPSSWCYERVTYTLVGGLPLTRLSLDLDVLQPVQDLSSCPLMHYRPSNSVRLVQVRSRFRSAKPVKRLHTFDVPSYLLEPSPLASGWGEENSPYREPPAPEPVKSLIVKLPAKKTIKPESSSVL